MSPEWTTDGTFAKAWRRVEGKPHLYKSGCRRSHGQDCTLDMAPFSEFFAAQLGEFLGLDVVSYDLVDWHDAFGSSCPLLNDIDVSFVSFYDAAHAFFWPQAGVVCALADKVLLERFVTMVVFDSLIVNPDRHGKNHGFLRDNHTGQIVGYAPLFDHNLALFARHSDLSADEMFERAHRTFPALAYSDFLSLDGMVLGEAQRDMLLRAKEFEFQNHPDFPVSDQRLGALNEFLAKRVDELLRIPVADHSLLFDCLCEYDYAGSTQAPLLELYAAKG